MDWGKTREVNIILSNGDILNFFVDMFLKKSFRQCNLLYRIHLFLHHVISKPPYIYYQHKKHSYHAFYISPVINYIQVLFLNTHLF